MSAEITLSGAVERIEGPLVFARRSARVGVNEAVAVTGADHRERIGRIAALDEQTMVIEVLESTSGLGPVSYTHLTLPTTCNLCRSRWSPYH